MNIKNVKALLCLLCICVISTPFSYAASGESRSAGEVLAIGTVRIIHGNLAAAKASAISEALVKGLEGYLADRLGSQGMVNNFERLATDIIPKAQELIESYYILSEYHNNKVYKILVQLRINEKVIEDRFREIGLIFGDLPQISVLFLVSESRDGEVYYWWKDPSVQAALTPTELALHHVFEQRGMSPISRRMTLSEDEYTTAMLSADIQSDSAIKWGELYSTDIVICGQTVISDESDEISLKLDVLDVKGGGVICQGMEVDRILESLEGREPLFEALERLVNILAVRFMPHIVEYAGYDQEKVYNLEVTLAGLTNHRQFEMFEKFLELEITGIKSVIQTRIKGNTISMAVEFQGNRNRFLDRVMNHEKLPFPLDFESVGENGILFRIKDVSWDHHQLFGDDQDSSVIGF